MPEIREIPIDELRAKVVTVEANGSTIGNREDEVIELVTDQIKKIALVFAKEHQSPEWLISALKSYDHIDVILSSMRHIADGQIFILLELQKLQPDLLWHRGGTMRKWKDEVGLASHPYFTAEQLNTYVIDGGKNGILGRPTTALGFLRIAFRSDPAFYTLTLSDLISGLQSNAVTLVSEHGYDLVVKEGKDRTAYLDFCRNRLKIDRVKLD